jgi:hypothetical protein
MQHPISHLFFYLHADLIASKCTFDNNIQIYKSILHLHIMNSNMSKIPTGNSQDKSEKEIRNEKIVREFHNNVFIAAFLVIEQNNREYLNTRARSYLMYSSFTSSPYFRSNLFTLGSIIKLQYEAF